MSKVALCLAGLNGAVGSTLAAGLTLLRRRLVQPQALISEPFARSHKLPGFRDIVVAGWDPRGETLAASCRRNQVLPAEQLAPIQRDLAKLKPLPAAKNHSAAARDIEKLRRQLKVETVVVLNLLPTGENKASAEYARAAALTGSPFVNFTPNDCAEDRLADIPFAGRDGKTGQTWLKSVLAPAFLARQLKVTGWFSTNLLGNEDGKIVGDPVKGRQKIRDKTQLLGAMLGYDPFHLVQINYFPPRGDTKESWDFIEIEGFLGLPMQFRISAQYRDSVLAAPMCLDLARFIALAHRQGARGPQTWLSLFFKAPYGTNVHDFALQHRQLLDHLRPCAAC